MDEYVEELEDNVRDEADESRSDLDRNNLLSTASRLSAIKHGINVDPEMKDKTLYRKVNDHQVQFIGELPNNKSFSYRNVDETRLFDGGIIRAMLTPFRWVRDKFNNSGIINNYRAAGGFNGNEWFYNAQSQRPKVINNIKQELYRYYDPNTGNLDVDKYVQDKGIRALTPEIEQAEIDLRNELTNDPSKSQLYQNPNLGLTGHSDLRTARMDPNSNAQQWVHGGQGIDEATGSRYNLNLTSGLTDRNKANLYKDVNTQYGNRTMYDIASNGITPGEIAGYTQEQRDQLLANQVNTYQNSSNQYLNAANQMNSLQDKLKAIQDAAVKAVNGGINGQAARDELNKLLGNPQGTEYNKAQVNAVVDQLNSQIKGHQASMNQANANLRAQGLTGIGDNKDYRQQVGVNRQLVYDPKTDTSKYIENPSDPSNPGVQQSKYQQFVNNLNDKKSKYETLVNDTNATLSRGTDANGNPLTKEAKEKLQEQLNSYQATLNSTNSMLAKAGDKMENGQYRNQAAYERRSTADRKQNEVTDINQFNAITGNQTENLGDPNKLQQDVTNAQTAYDEGINKDKTDQENRAREKFRKDYINRYKRQNNGQAPSDDKVNDEINKNFKFNYNPSKYQQGKGRNAYQTLQNAQKAVAENNGPKQIQYVNGNYVYGTQKQIANKQDQVDKQAEEAINRQRYNTQYDENESIGRVDRNKFTSK